MGPPISADVFQGSAFCEEDTINPGEMNEHDQSKTIEGSNQTLVSSIKQEILVCSNYMTDKAENMIDYKEKEELRTRNEDKSYTNDAEVIRNPTTQDLDADSGGCMSANYNQGADGTVNSNQSSVNLMDTDNPVPIKEEDSASNVDADQDLEMTCDNEAYQLIRGEIVDCCSIKNEDHENELHVYESSEENNSSPQIDRNEKDQCEKQPIKIISCTKIPKRKMQEIVDYCLIKNEDHENEIHESSEENNSSPQIDRNEKDQCEKQLGKIISRTKIPKRKMQDDVNDYKRTPKTKSTASEQSGSKNKNRNSEQEVDPEIREARILANRKRPTTCPVCDKDFRWTSHLKRHMQQHLSIRLANGFECALCELVLDDRTSLNNHLVDKHYDYETLHRCPLCDKLLGSAYALKSHMGSVHKQLTFLCDVCGKEFRRRSHLTMHLQIHLDVDSFKCKVCDKIYEDKIRLRQHEFSIHGIAHETVLCKICGDQFVDHRNLKAHLKTHSSDRDQCEFCGKKYIHIRSLRRHIKETHGDGKFRCRICDDKFMDKTSIKTHMEMHAGDSRCTCRSCGKIFYDPNVLQKHIKAMHSDQDRKYPCGFCGKEFVHENNLKRHVAGVHQGDTRYECPHCQKRFGNSYNLKIHIRIHTGDKPHICLCKKAFADICNYRRHLQKCGAK